MSKKNLTPESGAEETANQAVKQPKKKKKKGSGLLGRIVRRFFLLLFTAVLLVFAALVLVMNLVFNGPSIAAQEKLTMTIIEAMGTGLPIIATTVGGIPDMLRNAETALLKALLPYDEKKFFERAEDDAELPF